MSALAHRIKDFAEGLKDTEYIPGDCGEETITVTSGPDVRDLIEHAETYQLRLATVGQLGDNMFTLQFENRSVGEFGMDTLGQTVKILKELHTDLNRKTLEVVLNLMNTQYGGVVKETE